MSAFAKHIGATALCSISATAFVAKASPLYMSFKTDIADEDYKKLVQPVVTPARFAMVSPPVGSGYKYVEIGLGATSFSVEEEPRGIAEATLLEGKDFPNQVTMPHVSVMGNITEGLDIGGQVAYVPYSRIKIVSLGSQFNLIKGPAPLPDLSVRLGFSSAFGHPSLVSRSANLEMVGGLSYTLFNPYIGVGFALYTAGSEWSYKGSDGKPVEVEKKQDWSDVYLMLGTRVTLLPFSTLAIEANFSSIQSQFLLKLGFAI